jgi:hypothetical protein
MLGVLRPWEQAIFVHPKPGLTHRTDRKACLAPSCRMFHLKSLRILPAQYQQAPARPAYPATAPNFRADTERCCPTALEFPLAAIIEQAQLPLSWHARRTGRSSLRSHPRSRPAEMVRPRSRASQARSPVSSLPWQRRGEFSAGPCYSERGGRTASRNCQEPEPPGQPRYISPATASLCPGLRSTQAGSRACRRAMTACRDPACPAGSRGALEPLRAGTEFLVVSPVLSG